MEFKVLSVAERGSPGHLKVRVQRMPDGPIREINFHKRHIRNTRTVEENEKWKVGQLVRERVFSAIREADIGTTVGIRTALVDEVFDV